MLRSCQALAHLCWNVRPGENIFAPVCFNSGCPKHPRAPNKPVELKKKGGKPHNNHPYGHRLKFDLKKGLILIDTEQMSKGTICCSLGLIFDSMETATSHGTWAQTLARWPCHLSVVSNTGPGEASTVIGRLSAQQISEGPAVDTTI